MFTVYLLVSFLITFQLLILCRCKVTSIDKRISSKPETEKLQLLFTLKEQPDLSVAENPQTLYLYLRNQAQTSLGREPIMASFQSFDSFLTDNYRKEQGNFVHSKLVETSDSSSKVTNSLLLNIKNRNL